MKQSDSTYYDKPSAEQAASGSGGAILHPMQKKIDGSPRQSAQQNRLTQLKEASARPKPNGLPSPLRTGIETLSGMDMSDVVVHRNSDKPAQLNALAYAQGSEIHLGPGQDKHLPHEAWHVVQQKQGRVKPTRQMKGGASINTDAGLEHEADAMGAKASAVGIAQFQRGNTAADPSLNGCGALTNSDRTIQRIIEFEYDDVTGAELATNIGFDAEDVYLRLRDQCRIIKKRELRDELERFDGRNAIFSDTDELIGLLTSQGLLVKGATGAFATSAKVGLELTFNSPKSKEYLQNDGFPSGKKRDAVRWWNEELNGWTGGLEHQEYVDEYELEVDIEKDHPQKDFGGGTGDMQSWRVIYKNGDGDVVWWWQMSMDPSVVEIQAAPTTGAQFSSGLIADILSTIYERAAEREFVPGGGGGHINVDFKTGFNEDPSMIPKVLVATEIIVSNLKDSSRELAERLIDSDNELEDPFIGTKRVKMETTRGGSWDPGHVPDSREEGDYSATWKRDVLNKSGNKVRSMENLAGFREAHAEWLHMHPTLSQQKGATERTGKLSERKDAESLSATLHYQAVNIDHLFEKVTKDEDTGVVEDPRRLEFRFFKGQENIKDIIACIELIGSIVDKAKTL